MGSSCTTVIPVLLLSNLKGTKVLWGKGEAFILFIPHSVEVQRASTSTGTINEEVIVELFVA